MSECKTSPETLVPKTKDLNTFLDRFNDSNLFQFGCEDTQSGKSLSGIDEYRKSVLKRVQDPSKVENQEILDNYMETDEAKQLILIFTKKELGFQYEEGKLPKEVDEAFSDYREHVKFLKSEKASAFAKSLGTQGRQALVKERDQQRQFLHGQAAKSLNEAGLLSSFRMARTLARIMLSSVGLDSLEEIQADEQARYKLLAGNK
ncbi:hypothetical protein ACFL0Y_03280 [Patescibacteria group bacterium]